MKRKLIQITAVDRGPLYTPSIIGLCNDGTMWLKNGAVWDQVNTPPQPKSVKKEEEECWKTNYRIYASIACASYESYATNSSFLSEQEKFYPHINIPATIKKSYINFWGTEAGWKNKKNAARGNKAYNIDWKATWANALSNKINHVYLNNTQKSEPVRRAKSVN